MSKPKSSKSRKPFGAAIRVSEPESPKIRIPFGAAIYGTVTETVSQGARTVSVQGGGPFTSLFVKRGAFEAVLPSASIVGLPAGPIFIAWDGEQYVIKHSLKEIQADDNLTLIGSLEGSKVQTSPPPKSAPNSASPIRSGRMPSTVHSLVAVQRIEAFMAEKGLNQAEFATRAKTTYKTIHKIRKTAKITRSMLDDIAKALGITREELLKKS